MGQKKIISVTPEKSDLSRTPLLQEDLKQLYTKRAERMKTLAENNKTMHDYLLFAADITDAQLMVLKNHPLHVETATTLNVDWQAHPFQKTNTSLLTDEWIAILDALLEQLLTSKKYQKGVISKTIKRVLPWKSSTKKKKASQLLGGDFDAVGSDVAVFLWASLSLYFSQLSRAHTLILHDDVGVGRHVCPVCGSEPVASVIMSEIYEGTRYLHCNLCESKWYFVRAICTNCNDGSKVHYWTLDDRESPIKSESCGNCHSHLKIFYSNKEPQLEPVADDLASLALDALMEEEGFPRSAINPFLFPQ